MPAVVGYRAVNDRFGWKADIVARTVGYYSRQPRLCGGCGRMGLDPKMTISEWMIFSAVILYLLTIAPVKPLGYRTFDNSNPRDPTFYKSGIASRALGAHLNGIETFPFLPSPFYWPSSVTNRSIGSTFWRLHLSQSGSHS